MNIPALPLQKRETRAGHALITHRKIRWHSSQRAKFGSFTNSYRYLLSIQRTTIRIAQLDIVVTGSKREFLGLLDLVCKAAIDVDRGVLAIRLDLDVSKIRGHVVGLIRVRIRVGEKWVENSNWLNYHHTLLYWLLCHWRGLWGWRRCRLLRNCHRTYKQSP